MTPADDRAGPRILTVGQLNRTVSALLQSTFSLVWVAGEISNFTRAASGHWYFTLKDASASVRAVMFRGSARLVGFSPREGDRIEVLARVSLYEARGDFQLGVEQMRQAGAGDLYQRFLRLKAALQAEGLFDPARKRPLPASPAAIGIITSPRAAALRDVLTTLRRRAPQLDVILYPASVQGAQAVTELIAALDAANRRAECDVLLLIRGGGSIEDLDAFNDERLARRIAASRLPVVSGVGHETDFTISDFVADARAPTPTAAAVLVCRDRAESREQLKRELLRLQRAQQAVRRIAEQRLDLSERLLRSPAQQLAERIAAVERAAARLARGMTATFDAHRSRSRVAAGAIRAPRLEWPAARLDVARDALRRLQGAAVDSALRRVDFAEFSLGLVSPRAVLARGYAIVRDSAGRILRTPAQVVLGDALEIETAAGRLRAAVLPPADVPVARPGAGPAAPD